MTQDNRYKQYIAREAVRRLGEYYGWPSDHYTGSDSLFSLIGTPNISGVPGELIYTKPLQEFAAVSFSLEEQVYPLFDYAQYNPVKFIRGSWMVTGRMAIFYTERDWLFKQIKDFYNPSVEPVQEIQDFNYLSDEEKLTLLDELITISVDIENSSNTEMSQRIVNMINGIKQSVWKPTNQYIGNLSTKSSKSSYTPRFTEPEFNLIITHGPLGINERSTPGTFGDNDPINANDPLGTMTIFNIQNLIERQKLTSRVLFGIQIISHATRYNNDGQPIVDEYEFVAKDEMSLDDAYTKLVETTEGDITTNIETLFNMVV